ncbi:MAG: polysaccharide biosynthesis protein [Lachnospiraceae bacterium]|nr:polysaccharide biosynthesis protein [Lachnospiraceae bacterium]
MRTPSDQPNEKTAGNEARKRQHGGNFLAQGSILAVSGIIVRIIGLLYRVPVTNIIGEQGSGYYQVAYEIYNIALILSSYSLPLAVSKLMAAREVEKKYKQSFRLFVCAMAFAIVSGLLMSLIIFLGAGFIAEKFFDMPGVVIPLRVLAPTILVCAILGVLRGFYQGKHTMIPTALSQILEQIVNAAVSVGAAAILMKKYANDPSVYSHGAAGSTLGTFSGALIGLIFLALVYLAYRPTVLKQIRRQERKDQKEGLVDEETWGAIFKVLIFTIIPVILSQTIYQISGVLNTFLFNKIMSAKGMDESTRSTLTGIYGSKYRTLINVPIAISQAVETAMVPSLVASVVQKDTQAIQKKIGNAVKFNMMIAIPAAVGLSVLAKPIINLLFHNNTEVAYTILRFGAYAVIFYALSTVYNGVLQGINRMSVPVKHSAISLGINLILVVLLLRFTGLSIFSLVVVNIMFPLIVSILNWISVRKETGYEQELITTFAMPLGSSVAMGVVAWGMYQLFYLIFKSNALACLGAILIAVIVYVIMLCVLRCFTKEELYDFPMGARIVKILTRFRLL